MDFKLEFQNKREKIDQIMEQYLPKEDGLQRTVLEAMNYSVRVGGKRIRPMLMEETFILFQGDNREILEPFMAAMEMIHTYSLVHDDLPAMDNDEYRRGQLTTHKKYGESMGILAGDALLNYAFETATEAFQSEVEIKRVAWALQILSKKAGIYGMVGGQVVDVETSERELPMTKEKLDFIYQLKTSALIESSMMIGAILAGASKEDVMKMERVGRNIGLAFQIQDDILDLTSTLEELGKPIGSDEKNNKFTYVTMDGMEACQNLVAQYTEAAINELEQIPSKNDFLKQLLQYLVHRKY